jgi:hypothetical protein
MPNESAAPNPREILHKYYGTSNYGEVSSMRLRDAMNFEPPPPPSNEFYKMEFPYTAPQHPRLPSFSEIEDAWYNPANDLNAHGLRTVCRFGDCVIKIDLQPGILQVCILFMLFSSN